VAFQNCLILDALHSFFRTLRNAITTTGTSALIRDFGRLTAARGLCSGVSKTLFEGSGILLVMAGNEQHENPHWASALGGCGGDESNAERPRSCPKSRHGKNGSRHAKNESLYIK